MKDVTQKIILVHTRSMQHPLHRKLKKSLNVQNTHAYSLYLWRRVCVCFFFILIHTFRPISTKFGKMEEDILWEGLCTWRIPQKRHFFAYCSRPMCARSYHTEFYGISRSLAHKNPNLLCLLHFLRYLIFNFPKMHGNFYFVCSIKNSTL
jgi:hypothetical protein